MYNSFWNSVEHWTLNAEAHEGEMLNMPNADDDNIIIIIM